MVEALEPRQHLSAQQLDGVVVEGYLFNPQNGIPNLTVFADADGNATLDEGESSTISDATGHFSITTDVDPLQLRVVLPDNYVFRSVGTLQFTGSPPTYFVNLLRIRPITGRVYQDHNND